MPRDVRYSRAGFLGGRKGGGGEGGEGGAPSLEYRALIGQTAYVHPVTYTPWLREVA